MARPNSGWHPGDLVAELPDDGAGVLVGIVDTGLDALHPTLAGSVAGQATVDLNATLRPGCERRPGGHGTHVAGIVLAVAPGARLASCRALEGGISHARLLVALDWALDQRLSVLLLACGTQPGLRIFDRALAMLAAQDVLVVVAAGNRGPGTVLSPAESPVVLTVGAADSCGIPAPFSGSAGDRYGTRCDKPEILAPGVDVLGPLGSGAGPRSGTSQAAAVVAGAAARLRGLRPGLDAAEVAAALCATARPLPPEHRHRSRFGTLDLLAALDRVADPHAPPDPAPPAHDGSAAAMADLLTRPDPHDVLVEHPAGDPPARCAARIARWGARSQPPLRVRHLTRLATSVVTARAGFVHAAVTDPDGATLVPAAPRAAGIR